MATATRRPGLSPLVTFALVAVLLGLAAATLLAPSPSGEGVNVALSVHAPAAPSWLGIAVVLAFVGMLFVVGGISRGRPLWIIGLIAVCLGVGTAIAEVLRYVHPAVTGASSNQTGAQTPPSCSTDPSLCPYVFPHGPSTPSIGPWYDGAALYLLVIVAVVVAAVLVPRYLALRARGGSGTGSEDSGGAPQELTAALARLRSEGTSDDARRRIIRAYGSLLEHVAARLPNVEMATPREIAEEIQRRYRIQADTASEITALFEEARYSQGRPMAPDAVDRAEQALRRALRDVDEARRRSA